MPITIRINNHPAVERTAAKVTTSEELLKGACPKQYRRCERLVQSSFARSTLRTSHISASNNGFVWAAYHAYSKHHDLVIRPEDIWFAVLTQMSFFINANAEELRSFFVEHQGQEHLEAFSDVADFGGLAVQMTDLIAKNVIDPDLRDWVMPSFSTTTANDKVVGAVLFMGAMQKYFSYGMTVCCGIPSVTLMGEEDDWREILRRLDKVDLLGEEPQKFARMLRPIVQHMILSFQEPYNATVTQFWNTIVHKHALSSGTDYLTGWLTAFCFWNETGKAKRTSRSNIQFGDVEYPTVDIDAVPAGLASVPVRVDDNGGIYQAVMVAGSVGINALESPTSTTDSSEVSNASSVSSEPSEQLDSSNSTSDASDRGTSRCTVQPVSGWWIFETEAAEQTEAREAEKVRLKDQLNQIWKGQDRPDLKSEQWRTYRTISRCLSQLEAY